MTWSAKLNYLIKVSYIFILNLFWYKERTTSKNYILRDSKCGGFTLSKLFSVLSVRNLVYWLCWSCWYRINNMISSIKRPSVQHLCRLFAVYLRRLAASRNLLVRTFLKGNTGAEGGGDHLFLEEVPMVLMPLTNSGGSGIYRALNPQTSLSWKVNDK